MFYNFSIIIFIPYSMCYLLYIQNYPCYGLHFVLICFQIGFVDFHFCLFYFILYHNHLLHFTFLLPAFFAVFCHFCLFLFFVSYVWSCVSCSQPSATPWDKPYHLFMIQLTTTCTATAIRRIIHQHSHAILLLIRLGLLQGARRR